MTTRQVAKVLRTNSDAALYLWHGEVYLDDGESAQMISPSILCSLAQRGVIAPTDPSSASVWLLTAMQRDNSGQVGQE